MGRESRSSALKRGEAHDRAKVIALARQIRTRDQLNRLVGSARPEFRAAVRAEIEPWVQYSLRERVYIWLEDLGRRLFGGRS